MAKNRSTKNEKKKGKNVQDGTSGVNAAESFAASSVSSASPASSGPSCDAGNGRKRKS